MAKFRSIKNSFTGGQVSPQAVGRTDLPTYPHSCELLQNMLPTLAGGAYRRPGTFYSGASLPITTDYIPRILPFVASGNDPYCILLGKTVGGSTYAKFYLAAYSGSPSTLLTTSSGTVTGTHPYSPADLAYFASYGTFIDEWHEIQYAQSVDVMWLTHPRHKPQVIKNSSGTFTIGDYDASMTNAEKASSRPFLSMNITATTMQLSHTSGTSRTLTASAAYFTSDDVGSIYKIDDGVTVSACIVTGYTSSTVVTVDILVAANDTVAHANWWESAWSNKRGWPRSVCIFQQRLCMASTSTQPDTVWFSQTGNYNQWDVRGGTAPNGTVIVRGAAITVSTGYIHFPTDDSQGNGKDTGPTGIQPFRITLSQNVLDEIRWLSPDRELLIGTASQEWVIGTSNGLFDVANSPTGVQSHYGTRAVVPARMGYELAFITGQEDELRTYQYNYVDQSFFAEPVQALFGNYPKAQDSTYEPGVRRYRNIEWDVSRKTLWCLDTAGNFFGLTRDRRLNFTAWHTHKFGGYDASAGSGTIGSLTAKTTDPAYQTCDGSVLSFAVVPNPVNGSNDIWLVVKRTINGVINFQLERIIGREIPNETAYENYFPGDAITATFLVDAATVHFDPGAVGTKTRTVGAQLEAKTLVGTYYSPTYGLFKLVTSVVASGIATITSTVPSDYGTATNVLTLGLPFKSAIQTCRIEAGSVIGTAQGAIKRISRAFVRFYKSMYCKVGVPSGGQATSDLEVVEFYPEPYGAMGKSAELFTGDKKVEMPSTYDRDGYVYLESEEPLPLSVISISLEGQEFD